MSINMLNGRWAALSCAATLLRVTPIGGGAHTIHTYIHTYAYWWALEDDYRAYRETIAAALRVLRLGADRGAEHTP